MISCQFQSQKYRRNLHHNIITQIMSWWLRHLTAKKFGLLFQKWRILLIKKEVDYVWSLKLVLIQHSPWLLLVKIKCQLQNTWKIELWNKSEGWPPLTSLTPPPERNILRSVWRTEFYQSFSWLLSVLNILWVSQVL